ncbi:replication initiation protein [Hymenobacter glacieicola]|uniref:Initiator Rep protein domain-containing protein n=1 Tax=Hymenobacter glacieicola TaxID=1562124 RepID=A0ABQ1X8Q2_9BACT|nr:hypothetical protein GCM10011378_42180 [Hymenobacter glacieicola]
MGLWEVDFGILRKQILGDDNDVTYTLFYDFKRYVLEPALRELHSLGWMVAYEPLKEGKKVHAVRFSIPKPQALLDEQGQPIVPPKTTSRPRPGEKQMSLALAAELPTLQQRIVTRLHKLKMTDGQIQHVLDFMGDDEAKIAKLMKISHPLLRDFEAGNKVFDNLGGAAVNLLKAEFPGLYPVLK